MSDTIDDNKIAMFDGGDAESKFWRRLRTAAKKSEIMSELIKLRWIQIDGNLPDSDMGYFKRLIKSVLAEFKFIDTRINTQKIMGERKDAARKALDRRKILIGAFIEKMLLEAEKTGKPEFLRPWLSKGLKEYLKKPEDLSLLNDLLKDKIDV